MLGPDGTYSGVTINTTNSATYPFTNYGPTTQSSGGFLEGPSSPNLTPMPYGPSLAPGLERERSDRQHQWETVVPRRAEHRRL